MAISWSAARAFEVVAAVPGELRLCGELDDADVTRFRAAVDRALASEPEPEQLVLDLAGLTFLASAGVSELLRVKSRHPRVVLRHTRREVLRVIEVTGLLGYFVLEP